LATLTLGFLSLDGSTEDDLISEGALEQIRNFIGEHHPNDVAQNEDWATQDQVLVASLRAVRSSALLTRAFFFGAPSQGMKFKFIQPFLRLTYSRHLPVQRLGAFALATFAKRRAHHFPAHSLHCGTITACKPANRALTWLSLCSGQRESDSGRRVAEQFGVLVVDS